MFDRFSAEKDCNSSTQISCFLCYDRYHPKLAPGITDIVRRLSADLKMRGVHVSGDAARSPVAEVNNHQAILSSDFVILLASNSLKENNNLSLHAAAYINEVNLAMNLMAQGKLKLLPILCEGTLKELLPPTLQGKLSIAFTDITDIPVAARSENLRCGRYQDLFANCIAKALGIILAAPVEERQSGFIPS